MVEVLESSMKKLPHTELCRTLETSKSIINKSIHFDFGSWPESLAGKEMYKVENIKLPYKSCTYSFQIPRSDERVIILLEETDGLINFLGFTLRDKKFLDLAPYFFSMDKKNGDCEVTDNPYFYDLNVPENEKYIMKEGMENRVGCDIIFEAVVYANFLFQCKNINTVDQTPPEKVNKKRIRKGKLPLFTYKTLVFNQGKNSSKNSNTATLDNNRVHLCRGHFKHYDEDNKLFGRLTGTYWWQPQARGSKEKGMIHKDYKFKA